MFFSLRALFYLLSFIYYLKILKIIYTYNKFYYFCTRFQVPFIRPNRESGENPGQFPLL